MTESSDADPAERWGILVLVSIGLVLSMTTWFSATAVLGDLQKAFGLTTGTASWLTNAVQLGFVAASLALSLTGLIDVLPPRRLMAAAALVAALANVATALAPSAAWLFAARALNGIALAGVYPPALKLIATWFRTGRGLAMGLVLGALTFGSAMPYLVKAVGASFDWRIVLFAAAGSAALSAGLFGLGKDGPFATARPPKPDVARVLEVARDPDLTLANLGYYGHMWELYAMWGWFLAYAGAAAENGVAGTRFSPAFLTFCVVAVGAIGCCAGGYLADRIGRTATTAIMMIVSGTCALTIGFAFDGPAWLLIVIALVWGVTIIADSAQFSATATELSAPETTGAALALQVGVGFALTIVSIRLVPVLAQVIGWRWTFAFLAPGPYIGAAAMLLLRRRPNAEKIASGLR